MPMEKCAIVELHDVSPHYYDEIAQAIELLAVCGIEKYSLLLVPNFWDKAPIYKYTSFVKAIFSTGQELVLHGYNHKGKGIRLRDLLWTYGEGEFGGLTLSETYSRIEKALEMVSFLDMKFEVFVPPAWIGNRYLEDVLYSFEFKAVAYRKGIKHLDTGALYTCPVITFSNRPLLSQLSITFGPALFRLYQDSPILRLALHPRDFRDKRKIKLWRFLLAKTKKTRRLISYEELFSKSRLAPSLQGF